MSKDSIKIVAKGGSEFELFPVRMSLLPSQSSANWLRFQGAHIKGGEFDEHQTIALQNFMRKHKTEAITDGKQSYTIAGNGLAKCFPENFSKQS